MRYAEYPPPPALTGYVRCLWVLEGPPAPGEAPRERILPDGCMELIVHYGDRFLRYPRESAPLLQPRTLVVGQLTRYLEIQPTGAVGILGVRFEPGGARPFLRPSMHEIAGDGHAAQDVLGGEAAELPERLAEDPDDRARVARVCAFLLGRFGHGGQEDPIVSAAVRRIVASRGLAPVDDLSRGLRVSRRHLERRFRADVGLSPKVLARVVRLQQVFRFLQGEPDAAWVGVAVACGFYDQSHLTREFHAFAGAPPSAWLATEHPMADRLLGR